MYLVREWVFSDVILLGLGKYAAGLFVSLCHRQASICCRNRKPPHPEADPE